MQQAVAEAAAAEASPDIEVYWRAARAVDASPQRYLLLLGLKPQEPIRVAELVGRGLRFQALERFRANAGLRAGELAELVSIPERTLHRRRDRGRLAPDESDRLVRASRVFGRTLELFEGDADSARRWFTAPAKGLSGRAPIQLCRSDVGVREVEAFIERLESGVLS